MLPSRRLLWLAVVPVALSAAAGLEPSLLGPTLAVDALVVAAAAIDAWLSRRPLAALTRRAPSVMSLGRPNAVELEVTSLAATPLPLELRDDVFDEADPVPGPLRVTLAPGARARLRYEVTPRARGRFALGSHHVRHPSRLGLWTAQHAVAARAPVKVYPDLARLRAFDVLARQNRELALVRATRQRGGETEFARLRDYTRDDELRAVDWKATAKHGRLIAREYQLESNQNVMLALEGGRLMTAEVDGASCFEHALDAALMLAHTAARAGDRVGLLAFDERVRAFVAPAGGPGSARAIVRATFELRPRLVDPDVEGALGELERRVRRRALVVLFTQVLDDVMAQTLARRVRALARRHLPLVVCFRDPDVERLALAHSTALHTRGAAAEVLRWRDGFLRGLEGGGVHVLDVAPAELTGALVSRYLALKARHLL